MHEELKKVCKLEECCIDFVEKRFSNMLEADTEECGKVVDNPRVCGGAEGPRSRPQNGIKFYKSV